MCSSPRPRGSRAIPGAVSGGPRCASRPIHRSAGIWRTGPKGPFQCRSAALCASLERRADYAARRGVSRPGRACRIRGDDDRGYPARPPRRCRLCRVAVSLTVPALPALQRKGADNRSRHGDCGRCGGSRRVQRLGSKFVHGTVLSIVSEWRKARARAARNKADYEGRSLKLADGDSRSLAAPPLTALWSPMACGDACSRPRWPSPVTTPSPGRRPLEVLFGEFAERPAGFGTRPRRLPHPAWPRPEG